MDDSLKQEMIDRADVAVKNASAEYTATLKQRVLDLEKAIHQNNKESAIELAYNLETEAATFGWPRVTRISKWLRKVFSGEFDQKPAAETILKSLNVLKVMVSDVENPDEQRDSELFEELSPLLKSAISDI